MARAVEPRKRPSQDRAKVTRDHSLATAAVLFGERGVARTSTNRIAADAGVSIGTLYRYFSDRSVIVAEVLDRLLAEVERNFTERVLAVAAVTAEPTLENYTAVVSEILAAFTDVLVANARLVRALADDVQFYRSGLPELEPKLRMLVGVVLIQILGPGDDGEYEMMSRVLINTGFAAVLRATAVEAGPEEGRKVVATTAEMIGSWLYMRNLGD